MSIIECFRDTLVKMDYKACFNESKQMADIKLDQNKTEIIEEDQDDRIPDLDRMRRVKWCMRSKKWELKV